MSHPIPGIPPDVVTAAGEIVPGVEHWPTVERYDYRRRPDHPRVELRQFEYCRTLVWPSWAPGWVRCGSVVTGGRCQKHGHESGDFPDFPGLHLADNLDSQA